MIWSSTVHGQVFCHSANGVVIQNGAELRINGDLTNNGTMVNENNVQVHNQFISNGAYQGNGIIIMDGSNALIACEDTIGTLICQLPNGNFLTCLSDINVKENLDVTQSGINLNGHSLHLGSPSGIPILSAFDINTLSTYYFINGTVRQNLSTQAEFTFPLGSNALSFPLKISTLQQSPAEGWIEVSAHNAPAPLIPAPIDYLVGYWQITYSGISDSNWNAEFGYPASMVVGDESTLEPMMLMPGDLWKGPANSGADLEEGTFAWNAALHHISYSTFSTPTLLTAFHFPTSACIGDLDGDNEVNTADLILFLGGFGCVSACPYDFSGDDAVNTEDLILFLGYFGTTCN
ncbi:MAG: hypothetical protein KDC12_06205 [Flavobacteriales bacterium]|nr:hypothetical protein [Flavobacteriales bacterium]